MRQPCIGVEEDVCSSNVLRGAFEFFDDGETSGALFIGQSDDVCFLHRKTSVLGL